MTIALSPAISLPEQELEISAIRSQGAGGQNVNKLATAIHLRFDIARSSLPDNIKNQLLGYKDHRITKEGVLIIKAQRFRSQEKNREDAIARLREIFQQATRVRKPRRATKPSRQARQKRLDQKTRHGRIKTLRRTPVA